VVMRQADRLQRPLLTLVVLAPAKQVHGVVERYGGEPLELLLGEPLRITLPSVSGLMPPV
jgi:hypothetical protein